MFIHKSAEVSPDAVLKDGVTVWNNAQIREHAIIGENSIISKNVYIDFEVQIGKNCKIQNNVSVYHGVSIEDGVFIGPHVCFTNDKVPRAINPDGTVKSDKDWEITSIVVRYGASIGAHSVILPGVTIGKFAIVGAGSVVTHNVPPNGLVMGNPSRLVGWVCDCGTRLQDALDGKEAFYIMNCPECGRSITREAGRL